MNEWMNQGIWREVYSFVLKPCPDRPLFFQQPLVWICFGEFCYDFAVVVEGKKMQTNH